MQTATRYLWVGLVLVLAAAPARAQTSEITFKVDMSTAIENCAFDPASGEVGVPGSFNDWSTTADLLNDAGTDGDVIAGDGIYSGTVTIAHGDIFYKFWASDPLGWEDNQPTGSTNREYTVSGDAVLPVVEFFKDGGIENLCEATTYEIIFQVDMSVQTLIGTFDPETDVVTVAGGFNGWNASADTLVQDIFNPDVYIGVVEAPLAVPSTQTYKYIIGEPEDTAPDGWEGGSDRLFEVTGNETDENENGMPEVIVPVRYFDDVTPDDILTESATVVFEVDLRPAFYYLADNGNLPADTQTGEPVESIDGLFINGPIAGSADGLTDWATWGPDDLGQIASRQLLDDGTNGDTAAGDSVYTITYTYEPGTPKLRIGKFGINGYDNEGGFGADHYFRLQEGSQTIRGAFGAVLRADGTYTDDNGPFINDQDFSQAYDPYILIDNTATPPTVTVVRSGGESDTEVSVEPTGTIPTGVVLRGNYPNPFAGTTTFEYGIERSGPVHLAVYDLAGRRIAVLVDEVQTPDTYRVSFDAVGLASGVYVTRLQAGGTVLSRRLTVLN